MNLLNFFKRRQPAANDKPSGWQLRPNFGQGPFTQYYNTYIPRKINAAFFEFLRESIPIVDSAINRLVSLDGHIDVTGENEDLVAEIRDWMDNVRVNDMQRGMQAFHQILTAEGFEQGFALGEFVANSSRTDIVQLRVADSKFIQFKRRADGLQILQKSDDDLDYRPLQPDNLVYFSIHNENQNPYGTPLLRSCEFVSKILTTIQNATLNVWERFGDPSFSIIYKTSKRDGADLVARRKAIEDEFNVAIRAKREGKSADFIRAIDTNSEIDISVIGADGQILEMEIPARHMMEQIVAKTGLPPWMLGLHWTTTERLSNAEAEMLLSDVTIRQMAKLPLFVNLVKTMLILRGRTWQPGDWQLQWAGVNLHDLVAQAQARFLNAQADMYYLQNAASAGIEIDVRDLAIGKEARSQKPGAGRKAPSPHPSPIQGEGEKGPSLSAVEWLKLVAKVEDAIGRDRTIDMLRNLMTAKACGCHGQKELSRPKAWPELDQVEADYEDRLKGDWSGLLEKFKMILGLEIPKQVQSSMVHGSAVEVGVKNFSPLQKDDETWTFTDEERAQLQAAMNQWALNYKPTAADSPILMFYAQAFSLGAIRAADLIGKEQPLINIIKNREIYQTLVNNGFTLLKDNATRAILNKIIPEMEALTLAGANPLQVARRLEKLFGDANSNWARLARSEMSMAAETAKLAEWAAWKVTQVDFVPAPDGCPVCQSLAGTYPIAKCPVPCRDTHPFCRCATSPAESETE